MSRYILFYIRDNVLLFFCIVSILCIAFYSFTLINLIIIALKIREEVRNWLFPQLCTIPWYVGLLFDKHPKGVDIVEVSNIQRILSRLTSAY